MWVVLAAMAALGVGYWFKARSEELQRIDPRFHLGIGSIVNVRGDLGGGFKGLDPNAAYTVTGAGREPFTYRLTTSFTTTQGVVQTSSLDTFPASSITRVVVQAPSAPLF